MADLTTTLFCCFFWRNLKLCFLPCGHFSGNSGNKSTAHPEFCSKCLPLPTYVHGKFFVNRFDKNLFILSVPGNRGNNPSHFSFKLKVANRCMKGFHLCSGSKKWNGSKLWANNKIKEKCNIEHLKEKKSAFFGSADKQWCHAASTHQWPPPFCYCSAIKNVPMIPTYISFLAACRYVCKCF
jgi:hypothetical protein